MRRETRHSFPAGFGGLLGGASGRSYRGRSVVAADGPLCCVDLDAEKTPATLLGFTKGCGRVIKDASL